MEWSDIALFVLLIILVVLFAFAFQGSIKKIWGSAESGSYPYLYSINASDLVDAFYITDNMMRGNVNLSSPTLGANILVSAVRKGNPEVLSKLLENPAIKKTINDIVKYNGSEREFTTPLTEAVHRHADSDYDYLKMIKILLHNGADPNIKLGSDPDKAKKVKHPMHAAIHLAVANGYPYNEAVDLLLQSGANPRGKMANDMSYVEFAVRGAINDLYSAKVVKILMKYNAHKTLDPGVRNDIFTLDVLARNRLETFKVLLQDKSFMPIDPWVVAQIQQKPDFYRAYKEASGAFLPLASRVPN